MLKEIRDKLQEDADIIADSLETTFGSPTSVTFHEDLDGYGIIITYPRMGFGTQKTYIVSVVLDGGIDKPYKHLR